MVKKATDSFILSKVLLLDVDGVLVVPPKTYAEVYCEKYGVDPAVQQQFYKTKEFERAMLGKLDLADAMEAHRDLWQWEGDFEPLITEWLKDENHPDNELVAIVRSIRAHGVPVYLATQQEKRRAAYLREKFSGVIDKAYFSCEIGKSKDSIDFWQFVVEDLRKKQLVHRPNELLFFDDRQVFIDAASEAGVDARLYTKPDDVKNAFNL